MIIPIGIDNTKLNKKPLVTYTIIALCSVIWMFGTFRDDKNTVSEIAITLRYYFEHPYLEIPERFKLFLMKHNQDLALTMHDSIVTEETLEENTPEMDQVDLEQDIFEQKINLLLRERGRSFAEKWGLVPSQFSVIKLISSLFVHAGFIHLLGNMLFLFFTGPFLEDRWGRPFFAGFYFSGGILAGIMHCISDWGSIVPVVGASGAIAAVLGAFLIKFTFRRFNFIFFMIFYFRIIKFTFSLPAWVVIPIIFGLDLLMLVLVGHSTGIAHWAHLGGFGFGLLTVWLLKMSGMGGKINPGVFDPDFPELNPIDGAEYLELQGKENKALSMLQTVVTKEQVDPVVKQFYWEMALKHKAIGHMRTAAIPLFHEANREGRTMEAFTYWQVLVENKIPLSLRTGQVLTFMDGLLAQDLKIQAFDVLSQWLQNRQHVSGEQLLSLGRRAFRIDRVMMEEVCQKADQVDDITDEVRKELRDLLETSPKEETYEPPDEIALSDGVPGVYELDEQIRADSELSYIQDIELKRKIIPQISIADYPKMKFHVQALQIFDCKPVRLTSSHLEVNIEQYGNKLFKLKAVRGIVLGEIQAGEQVPHPFLDLSLDDLLVNKPKHRILRISGIHFMSQDFFPGMLDQREALLHFADQCAEESGAMVFTGQEQVTQEITLVCSSFVEFENRIYYQKPT